MSFDNNQITIIKDRHLPVDVIAGVQELPKQSDTGKGGAEYRKAERFAGRELIRKLVEQEIGNDEFVIFGSPNQKPQGLYGGNMLNISISHVKGLIGGVISEKRVVGLDLERMNRTVHPGLTARLLHPKEKKLLDDQISVLQVWTIKESALKWCGTGLRTAMSKICISIIDPPIYQAVFDDGKKAEICSFENNRHWISIAYEREGEIG